MTDAIPPSLEEVWDWKTRAEGLTAQMTREELIEFYRAAADRLQERLNVSLQTRPASASIRDSTKATE